MSYSRVGLAGLIPVGAQEMTLSDSTAIAVNSTLRAASVLLFSVETQSARFSMSATPALTTGVLFRTSPGIYMLEGYNGTSKAMFQRSTGTCTVQIEGFRHPGDGR